MNWKKIIQREMTKDYFIALQNDLDKAYAGGLIYPSQDNIFRAFELCDYTDVKLVIIGQDPYHGEGQANGLAFSVYPNTKLPPSLRNIYKELESDLGIVKESGELEGWASQGVLLLNKILTVQAGEPASHKDLGWDQFTNAIISALNEHPSPIIYILWGKFAQGLKPLIGEQHMIIESAHPSPLAAYRGFFGSKPFSLVNEYLVKLDRSPIDWSK
ncbi:MAG: uracil-DNA glycosylase [Erysipelothrix sp.]|nr:uracil-DNA glycosylase [Erysipelothrix sp.]